MSASTEYLKAYRPAHPLVHSNGYIRTHRLVLWQKIGPGVHPCHWCATSVAWEPLPGQVRLVTDHLDNDKRNNTPGNLVPSCQGCNTSRAHGTGRFATHCRAGHEWTPENTYLLKNPSTRNGWRQCRACNAKRMADRRASGLR